MRKFFSTMLLAAAATCVCSCSESGDDITDTFKGDKYSGTMIVTTPAMYSGGSSTDTTQSDVTFYFDEDDDMATVSMAGICFTEGMDIPTQMPSLDIVLPNIPESSTVDDLYQADSVTATSTDGQPFANTTIKSITNVIVKETDSYISALSVSFDCTVSIDMGSGTDVEVTFSVAYSGTEL